MEGAQTIFKEWLKSALAPSLRGIGFKGSGQSYSLEDDECWALLGVQKSRHSTRDMCEFTVNLSVTNKLLWSERRNWQHYWMAARPSANGQSPGQLMIRLGNAMPGERDVWWRISASATPDDLEIMRLELVEAIREFGLPALREMVAEQQTSKLQDRIDGIRRVRPRPSYLK